MGQGSFHLIKVGEDCLLLRKGKAPDPGEEVRLQATKITRFGRSGLRATFSCRKWLRQGLYLSSILQNSHPLSFQVLPSLSFLQSVLKFMLQLVILSSVSRNFLFTFSIFLSSLDCIVVDFLRSVIQFTNFLFSYLYGIKATFYKRSCYFYFQDFYLFFFSPVSNGSGCIIFRYLFKHFKHIYFQDPFTWLCYLCFLRCKLFNSLSPWTGLRGTVFLNVF